MKKTTLNVTIEYDSDGVINHEEIIRRELLQIIPRKLNEGELIIHRVEIEKSETELVKIIEPSDYLEMEIESHDCEIICPNCGSIEMAKILHTIPFPTYLHDCKKCNYKIMESEWNSKMWD